MQTSTGQRGGGPVWTSLVPIASMLLDLQVLRASYCLIMLRLDVDNSQQE